MGNEVLPQKGMDPALNGFPDRGIAGRSGPDRVTIVEGVVVHRVCRCDIAALESGADSFPPSTDTHQHGHGYLPYSISILCAACAVPFSSMRQSGMRENDALNSRTCGCSLSCDTSALEMKILTADAWRFFPFARNQRSTKSFISMRTPGH